MLTAVLFLSRGVNFPDTEKAGNTLQYKEKPGIRCGSGFSLFGGAEGN
jgi:hypothetical protein